MIKVRFGLARRWIATAAIGAASVGRTGTATAQAPAVRPVQGLVVTTSDFYGLVGADINYVALDMENHLRIQNIGPDATTLVLHLGAPTDGVANAKLQRYEITQKTRKVDLDSAMRLSLFWSSDDPSVLPGQTFGQISKEALRVLDATGKLPLVLGTNTVDKTFGAISSALGSMPSSPAPQNEAAKAVSPRNLSYMFALLGAQRRYYRGTLHRVGTGPVPFPVILNGVRTMLPAVHAAGDFHFGTEPPVHMDFWWLDEPGFPLTLKWAYRDHYSVVIRIDAPVASPAAEAQVLGTALAGKSCRIELHGLYFATGSAEIMPESDPMLAAVATLIKAHPDWKLTVEGHTDSIGSAAYNQDLSERRAGAVRKSLVSRYGVSAAALSSKGYGFTRPVESNATVEGRAHNRRVELSRPCGSGGGP